MTGKKFTFIKEDFFRYLEYIENELETEDDFNFQRMLCKRVIRRLVNEDRVLIELVQDEDPTLVVHPNYDIIDE